MTEINMLEAKTNLTKLIKLVETNKEDEIIICRRGEPCAKLIPYHKEKKKRIVGMYRDKYPNINWNDVEIMNEDIMKDIDSNLERIKL